MELKLTIYPDDTISTCLHCEKEIISGPLHNNSLYKWFHIHNCSALCKTFWEGGRNSKTYAEPKEEKENEWW